MSVDDCGKVNGKASCRETDSGADDEYWMNEALALAEKAKEFGEVPVGAVLVRQGEVIGRGWNQPIVSHDPSAHAEIMALRDAAMHTQNYRLPDTTLYVTIEPCTMCAGALIHARVQRLVYGAREPRAGAVASQSQVLSQSFFNHQIDVCGGVLEKRCAQLITVFFQQRRIKPGKIS